MSTRHGRRFYLNISKHAIFSLDHFARDNFLEDDTSGLFGILDGHGGGEVAKYCVKSIPDVIRQLSYLCSQNIPGF